MKILVCPDSFKGTLSAGHVADLISDVLRESIPDALVVSLPLADGGEGTLDVVRKATGGSLQFCENITGPLSNMRIKAPYGWLPASRIAIVEMARTSGLPLLETCQRDPLKTTTYGTGEMLRTIASEGAEKILLSLGGSATVDGGTGAARACGWEFTDKHGQAVPAGGCGLPFIHRINPPDSPWNLPPLDVLCDVTNPLCGEKGAARVFAPQKGASPEAVETLEKGLLNLNEQIAMHLNMCVADFRGSGAAGGFGAGAKAFLDGRLRSGFNAVAEILDLDKQMADATWCITGEGKLDEQSLQGKVVSGVRDCALHHGVQVGILAGSVALPFEMRNSGHFRLTCSASANGAPPKNTAEARENIRLAATELAKGIKTYSSSP